MAKFLDEVGLGRVWSIIKSAINQLVSDIQGVQDKVEQYSQMHSSITNEEIDTLFVRDNQIVTYGDVTVNTDLIL